MKFQQNMDLNWKSRKKCKDCKYYKKRVYNESDEKMKIVFYTQSEF